MIKRSLAVATLLGAMLLGTALPAAAAYLDCPSGSGYVCLYKDAYYERCVAKYSGSDSDYSNNSYDYSTASGGCDLQGLNDSISSIKNRGNSYNTRHYEHKNYSGAYRTLLKGGSWPTVFINDELSSHQWIA